MTGELKPYPEYKDSGVEWLGKVPVGWEVRRLGSVTEEDSRRGRGDLPLLSVVRESGVIKRLADDDNHNVVPEDLSNYKVVSEGSLAINKMKAWQGSLGISPMTGIVSPAYYVYRVAYAVPQFLHRLLRSRPYVGAFAAESDGVRVGQWDLSRDGFKAIPALVPPPVAQAAIVRYLDHVDSRIQRLIEAKERLIELLEEEKQAIIHRAVTRGLDPDVPLKPSGIDWLGEIPEDWEVVALKRAVRRIIDCEHKTAPAVDSSDYTVVRTSAVRNGGFVESGAYCTTAEAFHAWTRRGRPEPGDVLLTREAPAGEACLVPADGNYCLGQRMVLLKPDHARCIPGFLVHSIYGGEPRYEIEVASQGSTVPHLNVDDIGRLILALPPVSEQRSILAETTKRLATADRAYMKSHRHIGLLREYRTRLTSDVVTGKLDVREAAAQLPGDNAEVDQQLEEAVA